MRRLPSPASAVGPLGAIVLALVLAACGGSPGGWALASAASLAPTASAAGPSAVAPSAGVASGGPASPSAAPGATSEASLLPSAGASGSPEASAPAAPSPATPAGTPAYTFKGIAPCPGSRFTCISLAVPRDHFTAGGPTWEVTFAIQKAAKQRKGVFVTITGGPGTSGIASADSYTDAFDPAITDNYDIVFLDQRGVGRSHPIQCPNATAVYYSSDARPQDPAQAPAVGAAASAYVSDCLSEAKADTADLPFYSTTQAVEDLEAFRQYLGVDKIDLYGESYGSQYVQTYAAAHPSHIAALFVDGPVDLTTDGIAYYVEGARAFDDVLVATLDHCTAERSCRGDAAGGNLLTVYDGLRSKLAAGPITFRFPTAKGTFVDRRLTTADLENAAVEYLYSPFARWLLERALTAASHRDYVPLARIAYDGIAVDPETLQAIPDPTYSDAMYYAVECQDYAYYLGGDPSARLGQWLAAGKQAGVNDLRLGTTFYGDLPCLYWPSQPTSASRPAPILDPPYPTFVMTATLDPAVPIANAMRIYSRLTDAYFIETIGGAHVIFGRGDACPDQMITDFLATGKRPAARVTTCSGDVADAYVRNARAKSSDYPDALSLMASMDDQISSTDDYNYRLDTDPITMGCDFGGTLRYQPVSNGTRLTVKGCQFTKGAAMTGSGLINTDAGTFRLAVNLAGGGRLAYLRAADGVRAVTGTYRGRRVNLRR